MKATHLGDRNGPAKADHGQHPFPFLVLLAHFPKVSSSSCPKVISTSAYSQYRPVYLTCHLYISNTTEWKHLELMGCGIVTPDCSDRSPWTRAKHHWHGPFRVHPGLLSGVIPARELTAVTFQRCGSYCSHTLLCQWWQGEKREHICSNLSSDIFVVVCWYQLVALTGRMWLFIYLLFCGSGS